MRALAALSRPLIALVVASGAGLVAGLAGLVTGLASGTLYVIGLYEVAAGLALGVMVVAWAHLWGLRSRALLWSIASLCGVVWLGAHRGAEAWLFRQEQGRQIGEHGLLLAEEAVLHDSDDPLSLVDASLMAETGSEGVRGAAALILRRGVTVQRALGVDRIVPAPWWVHALLYALQALAVTFIVGRALQGMASEPTCAVCGVWLRRRRLGYLSPSEADPLISAWASGARLAPGPARPTASEGRGLVLLEDRCPLGHELEAGWEVRRRRTLRLVSRTPGRLARLPPVWPPISAGGAAGRPA